MRSGVLVALCFLAVQSSCADHDSGFPSPLTPRLDVRFATRLELPLGVETAVDLEIADLNGDDRVDFAVLDLSGYVQILTQSPALGEKGIFVEGPSYQLTEDADPLAIRAHDLDLDDDLDLCIVSSVSNDATVLLNVDGTGVFTALPPFDLKVLPVELLIEDFDADSIPDLIVTHLSNSDLQLFPGNGDGTFGDPSAFELPSESRAAGLRCGDVNGDGFNDVLVCDTDHDQIVVIAGGDEGLERVFTAGVGDDPDLVDDKPISISLGDVDGDGSTDVVVSNFAAQQLEVLTYVGDDRFDTTQVLALSGNPIHGVVADVTGDGRVDMSVCFFDRHSVSVLAGEIGGLSPVEMQLPASGFPYRPRAVDLVGGEALDLVVAANFIDRLNVYETVPLGGIVGARAVPTTLENPDVVAVADFDGDGIDEVAVGGRGETRILLLNPAPDAQRPGYREVVDFDIGRGIINLVARDADGDGRVDLIAAVDGGVRILANTSTQQGRSFRLVPTAADQFLAPGDIPVEVAVGDVTGDGAPDLLVSHYAGDKVTVVPSLGGSFEYGNPVDTPVAGNPVGLVVFDYDADGDLEVAVSRSDADFVTVFEPNPGGRLTVLFDTDVPMTPSFVRTADFNGDGRGDLVFCSASENKLGVLVATGARAFAQTLYDTGDFPTGLLVADLDNDRLPDVLVASLAQPDFRVLIGDGNGGFAQQLSFPGTYGAASIGLADLSGSGFLDLVIGNNLTERLTLCQNISVAISSQ